LLFFYFVLPEHGDLKFIDTIGLLTTATNIFNVIAHCRRTGVPVAHCLCRVAQKVNHYQFIKKSY